jgi:hypothetical protein
MTMALTDLGERKKLILDIISKLKQSPDGRLDWKTYFDAHPAHSEQLGYPGTKGTATFKIWAANNVMARYMFRNGNGNSSRVSSAVKKALAPYKVQVAKPRRKKSVKWTKADYKLAAAIAEVYSEPNTKGQREIKWERAFVAHPEWKEQLSKGSEKSMLSFLSRVRRKLQEGTLVPETAATSLPNGTPAAPPPPPPPQIHFCPGCGLNLLMFSKAFSIAMKHSA